MSKATQTAKIQTINRMAELRQKIANLQFPPKITEAEKAQFAILGDGRDMYTAIRDCFYGFSLDDSQKELLKLTQPIKELLRKIFLPEIKKDIPLGQSYDLWQTQDIKGSNPDSYEYFYDAKILLLGWLEKSLQRMDNPELEGVDLTIKDNNFSFAIARNGYLSYIDQQVRFLIEYANTISLSDEERQLMAEMNSSK